MNSKDAPKINALLAGLWERSLPLLRERLEVLDRVATEAALGEMGGTSRIEALEIAHKLAGSLGMFGYTEGTEIARRLEQLLDNPALASPSEMAQLVVDLRRTLRVE